MNIFDEKRPLKIVFRSESGMSLDRVIANLFKTSTGICFFDIGWYQSAGHPAHFIDGEVTGQGPWTVKGLNDREYVIEVMDEDDPMMDEWAEWQEFLREENIPGDLAEKSFKKKLKIRESR